MCIGPEHPWKCRIAVLLGAQGTLLVQSVHVTSVSLEMPQKILKATMALPKETLVWTSGAAGNHDIVSKLQTHPNLAIAQPRLSRVKKRSCPARGTNSGVFVPIWPVMRMLG